MENLTFGEQVKIILGRKGMTIKELAEIIEERTGKKMSRQNLTQRLGRDNFQEQDMRMIADILGCSFQLSILSGSAETAAAKTSPAPAEAPTEQEWKKVEQKRRQKSAERTESEAEVDMTIGELYEIHEELSESELSDTSESELGEERKEKKERFRTGGIFLRKKGDPIPEETPLKAVQQPQAKPAAIPDPEDFEPVIKYDDVEEDLEQGEVNPYTGREYQTNSVRMHPSRIGYVQVYDRATHKWTDMTEWAFLGYQERKKALMGKEYEPPIYLD